MGGCTIDDIIKVFGKLSVVARVKVSGEAEEAEALLGFVNLDGLRNLFNRFVHFAGENYLEDSFLCPDKNEVHEYVALAPEQEKIYQKLRKKALAVERGQGNPDAYNNILSIIRDMDRLTLDIDTYEHVSTYIFEGLDKKALESMKAYFEGNVSARKKKDQGSPVEHKIFNMDKGKVCLILPEHLDYLLDDLLRDLDIDESMVTHPLNPKYERLVELMEKYYNKGGKQLIFTEEKSHHRKLRRIIAHELSIPINRIGIINADESAGYRLEKTIKEYNFGDVDVVIANRKAELGVNLQIRTTAIHHLTLPWTPASIQQRNGRGIRQGNTEEEVVVHYYFGEKTLDFYRHTILDMKANWINELLEGDKPTMPNSEAPDIEEILDMLSDSPEEAQKRRLERQKKAEEFYLAKQRDGLFNMLKTMTEEHAKTLRLIKRKNQEKAEIEKEFSAKIRIREIQEEEKKKELQKHREAASEYGSAKEIEAELEKLRANTKAEVDEYTQIIDELSKKLYSMPESDPTYHELKALFNRTKLKKQAAELALVKTAAQLQTKKKYLDYKSGTVNDLWRNEFNKQKKIRFNRIDEELDEAQDKDAKYLEQSRSYFKEMHKANKLPFEISILDSIGNFLVTDDHEIVCVGDKYVKQEENDAVRGIEVLAVNPLEKTLKVAIYDRNKGKQTKSLGLSALTSMEKLPLGDALA
jgi:hypothetical protein